MTKDSAIVNLSKTICVIIASIICTFETSGQIATVSKILDSLNVINNNPLLSNQQKLNKFYELKRQFEAAELLQDSVYAKLLHKIGTYEWYAMNDYGKALEFTLKAAQINTSGKPGSSEYSAIPSFYNIAWYYNYLKIFNKALAYTDTVFLLAKKLNDTENILDSKLLRIGIFLEIGDYEKCVEESIEGIKYALLVKDSSRYLSFLNQKAQAHFFQNQFSQALHDVNLIIDFPHSKNEPFELSSALKTQAFIFAQKRDFNIAHSLFEDAIRTRMLTKSYSQIATDYNDYANFLLDSLHNYSEANKYYLRAIGLARKIGDAVTLSMAHLNLAEVCMHQRNLNEAWQLLNKAFEYLKIKTEKNILSNPPSGVLNFEGRKELVYVNMLDRCKILLRLFAKCNDKKYLRAALETALLTDTIITQTRHEQIGEQSKLYWRNRTREFFTNAIEACYLANDAKHAFYFMEKSTAVLLNDKLNELGAAAHLPNEEAEKQERLQVNIIEQQQKLSALPENSAEYNNQQQKLLEAKDEFERYIKSIEKKYPAYYQYKYADEAPSLNALQQYLAANKQSFVHYFINDTIAYILSITSGTAKFIKLSKNDFNAAQLFHFLQLCADKQALNNNYTSFSTLSNKIYKSLFEPLQLPRGRLVICADNFLIPFEALCTDENGKRFLLYDYAFTYVYSARYLMKQFNNHFGKGNFLGIAPVTFADSLHVNTLRQSAEALKASAAYYSEKRLLTQNEATRKNFMLQMATYTIVNVFSHARADSSDTEPELFMADSVIHLSELQLLNNPATRLVVLSACQTNVGRNATGEGIYSLARGFASAGIPSIAATLWKADEQTIYAVSEKFHQYLSEGMNKDEALQEAKLYFIQNSDNEKLLPYYWANMILMGDAKPVQLAADHTMWWWFGGLCGLLIIAFIIFRRRNAKAKL